MVVDFRKQQREQPPIHIDGTVVEKVESFKWRKHHGQTEMVQTVLKKVSLSPKILTNLYRCTIESILSGCITAWNVNCTALNRKVLQRVVRSVQSITGGKLPALHDTYSTRCHRKAKKIIKDNNHPSHCLFTPLSSIRRGQYRCINAGTERLFLKTVFISRPTDC